MRAISAPIPEVLPVTRARLFANCRSISASVYGGNEECCSRHVFTRILNPSIDVYSRIRQIAKRLKKRIIEARPRNAAMTREAILGSARRAFARAGYDGAGVREIAAGAGVTAMLVNRYFGSKEKLFAEVVAETMTAPEILTRKVTSSPTLGEDLASAIVDQTRVDATPLDGFVIMLRSASNKRAAEIWRGQVEAHHQKLMTEALGGNFRVERAAMVLSLIAGFQFMRQMIGLYALAEADPMLLKEILTPLLQQLVAGKCTNGD
jgi:AcrR family transcriptional regulator